MVQQKSKVYFEEKLQRRLDFDNQDFFIRNNYLSCLYIYVTQFIRNYQLATVTIYELAFPQWKCLFHNIATTYV